jgi:pSer/pThr/pTyr-binding forkhead associated (FHA) protein
MLSGVGIA